MPCGGTVPPWDTMPLWDALPPWDTMPPWDALPCAAAYPFAQPHLFIRCSAAYGLSCRPLVRAPQLSRAQEESNAISNLERLHE